MMAHLSLNCRYLVRDGVIAVECLTLWVLVSECEAVDPLYLQFLLVALSNFFHGLALDAEGDSDISWLITKKTVSCDISQGLQEQTADFWATHCYENGCPFCKPFYERRMKT
jgi:hypothetical protein